MTRTRRDGGSVPEGSVSAESAELETGRDQASAAAVAPPPPSGTPLFRPQAVAYHAASRRQQRDVTLDARPTRWAFRSLLAALALVFLAGWSVRADETTRGTAQLDADGRTAVVEVPAAAAGRLRPGQFARIGPEATGRVTGVGVPSVQAGRAVVPVEVTLDRPVRRTGAVAGEVRLGRTRVLDLVLERLSALWQGPRG